MFDFASKEGGGGNTDETAFCVLCKLSDSFYRNPHHLENDFLLNYSMMTCLVHTKLAQRRILILCLNCLHNVLKHTWNQYKIWKYTYVHSFLCFTIKYDNSDLMQFSYDHYDITPTLTLAQVQAQNNSCPCSALHLLDCHSSLKYRKQKWNPCIWFLALASTYICKNWLHHICFQKS